jgi:dTDP-4-dehydrorhamnose 3,5-epimerase
MIFTPTDLKDAFLVDIEPRPDARGFFARAWCRREFETYGLSGTVAQSNIGVSPRKGTLRGLHYQLAPHEEVKLVRCTRGGVYDVIVDLRPQSSTYKRWLGVELSADNYRMLYVPEGFAHGYQTLSDDTELWYQTSQFYAPEFARGVRYDDQAFDIRWPLEVTVISDADHGWPLFDHSETSGKEH